MQMRFDCPWALSTLALRCPKDVAVNKVLFQNLKSRQQQSSSMCVSSSAAAGVVLHVQ